MILKGGPKLTELGIRKVLLREKQKYESYSNNFRKMVDEAESTQSTTFSSDMNRR